MEKTIKYLENGEYHYATVRDVGDLAKLKTDSKEDLVAAINDLFDNGGKNAGKPEGYDKLVDNVAGAIQKQQQMTDTITNMQQSAQLSDAEMEHMKQVQEELHQEYLKAIKELNEAVEKAKADAAALDKKTNDMQDKIDETFADVNKEVSDVHKQLDAEAQGLHKDLDETKTNLEVTRKDLLNSTQEYGQVHSEVKELQDKFSRRVWSTDLDPVREQVSKNSTEVQQTKDELKNKADQSNLDLVTNSVENLSAQVKQNASGLEVAVKKDELGGDVARLLNDKTNLLLGTRSFSGEDNWENRDAVTIEPGYYKGLKSVAVQVTDSSIYQPYHIKANTAYTFSFFGKEDKDNSKTTLIIKPIDAPNINIDNAEQPVHITTEWQRFAVTFSADQDCDISIQIIQGPEASNNILHLAGFKLQYGQNNTPWEPNEADVAENIEHTESQFNVYSDQIAGIVKKQEKMGDTERQLDTRITETAEGLKQTSKDLQDANGKITEFKGQLESTARGLKTEYEKYTNDAVGQISDSTLNLIRNSSFQNKDEDFAQWQNISAKANIRQDENGLRWVELTQSGMTTDNIVGLTSNYFNIKQGKVTVAVDIKSGTKADLDIESVLTLELYDENKKRVDFTRLTLNDLGLNKSLLGDHQVHRGLYRLGIDRNDAKYMTVKALLVRNGDLYFTNFSARLSSIDDGAYEPNPDDINQQILKMNTRIEQDAQHIALKANSADVTRNIKDAVNGIQVGGTNLAAGTNQEYTMGYGIPNTIWKDGFAYGTLPITGSGNEILPQDPHMFWYTLTAGQEYTQTIWFKTDATVKDLNASGITWFTGDGHDYQPATIQRIGPNSYKLFSSYKWPGKNNNDVRLFDISELRQAFDLNTGTYLKFGKLKLEEGNKSTSWSPAPEDTSAEIKSAKDAAIQVASDQINIHVNELTTSFDDKLNTRVNEAKTASEKFTSDGIEQTVRKITNVKNDVDRLGDNLRNIGSRNLLHNTSDQWRTLTNDGAWLQQTTASSCWTSTSDYHSGDKFTYAAKITNNSHQQAELEIWLCDQNKNLVNGQAFHAPIPKGANAYDANVTFPITTGTWYIRSWIIFTGGHAPKGDIVQVKDERLVEGATPGSWTPNPDDINQQITNTNKKIDTQTIDSANIDQMLTQGHYFVRNLTGNPIGGWVYVDVTGNNNDRIRQDVYADQNNQHKYRSWNGLRWSGWEQGAYLSDVSSLKTEVTASVKNLGDRVTTEVNSITTRMSDQIANAVELIQKSDFSDGSKGSWTVQGIVSANNPAPPAELGISGMKVIQSNERDNYEDIWHSVTPGEKFNIDFWCAPSSVYDSSFGLVFYDTNKKLVPNNQWLGVRTDHSGQWKHYTGEITAPGNSAFAKPWFQIDMPFGQHNTSWLAKPHIRRQDPRVTEAIKEVNTKWDVANGQIQGKVTATDVNNIINGKGYATQSWAQTMFQMKSDSITLQAVRDNITNGIQNQVNDARNILNNLQVGGRNYLQESDKLITGWGQDLGTLPHEVLNSLAGKTITVSVDVEWSNFKSDGSKQNRLGFELSASGSDGHSYWLGAWKSPTTASGKERVSTQYSLPAGVTFTVNNKGANGYVSISGTGKVSHAKIEVGTKPTDWSPAPEDSKSYTDQQITNTNKKIDTQTLDSANIDQMKTQGHYFVKNLTGNPIPGWVYVDVTGNNNDRIRQDVYADQSYVHKFRSWNGSRWTEWEEEVKNTDIISKINISPEQIKLASNKIEIDGNTYIHGDLQTENVRLVGKKGVMDLSGDSGLVLQNNNGSIISLGESGLDLKYKNDFEINIDSQVMTLSRRNGVLGQEMPIAFGNIGSVMLNKDTKSNGFMLRYNPGSPTDPKLAGASFMAFGYNTTVPGEIQSQMIMYAKDTQITGTRVQRKGIHFLDAIEFDGNLPIRFPSAHDSLLIHSRKWPVSSQPNYFQPSLSLTSDGVNSSEAGVTFLWDQLKPFGNRDISDLGDIWFNGLKFRFGWVHNSRMMNGTDQPAFMRIDPNNGSISSGIAFSTGSTWDLGTGAWNITASVMNHGG